MAEVGGGVAEGGRVRVAGGGVFVSSVIGNKGAVAWGAEVSVKVGTGRGANSRYATG